MKYLLRRAQRLLKAVVEKRHLAYRIVKPENRDDKGDEDTGGHSAAVDLAAPEPQEQRNSQSADDIHERRTHGLRRNRFYVGAEKLFGSTAKAVALPVFHAKRLYDPVAGNAFMQNILDIGELVLTLACSAAHTTANFTGRKNYKRNKDQQHDRQLMPQHDHYGN